MTGAELIAIISVGSTAVATLITTIFTSMSLSRCKNLRCCWWCCNDSYYNFISFHVFE